MSKSRIAAISVGIGLLVAIFGPATAGASTGILYDQTTGAPGGFVPSEVSVRSSSFECSAPTDSQDCYAADDFAVPPGPAWYIEGVHVDGKGGVGDEFAWAVEPGGRLPGEDIPASSTSGAGSANLNHSPLSGADNFDIPADLRYPTAGVGLLPGHYWLKVWVEGYNSLQPSRKSTPWAWQTQSPQMGYEAAWQDYGCGGHAWKYLSECGMTGPDLRFRITGQMMDSAFGSFQLGKPKRINSGGLAILATVPGPGTITIRKVSGKGKITPHVSAFFPNKGGSGYLVGLKIKPTAKTKSILKQGKKLKERVKITYTRFASNSISAPPTTQIINVVLKKPGRKAK